MTKKQIKQIQDRNQTILLALLAVVLLACISFSNRFEQKAAEKANIINHGSVPYWMQK